ncbi:MAG: hemerythrin domain-containing protein [Bdellovibrionales bacterium]|nr:hemerythrin domain-containing protein [Bdellovibrionales bacterium]
MRTHNSRRVDPLKKQAEHGATGNDFSPMAPPDAYAPPAMDKVSAEEMHPFLRQFVEEHATFIEELKRFEEALLNARRNGITKELYQRLTHFFGWFDRDFIRHSRREEVTLFPLLRRRLISNGEHGKGEKPETGVDLMDDDHVKAVQTASVILNFLELALRLPDERSRLLVFDAALEQGVSLAEMLRLHIFREDNILFASAHRLISSSEFDVMENNGG